LVEHLAHKFLPQLWNLALQRLRDCLLDNVLDPGSIRHTSRLTSGYGPVAPAGMMING
jgi:hypothetical protein